MRPWLSVWLKPGDTIEPVLARHPRRGLWLLAALGGIAGIVTQLISAGWTTELLSWRAIIGATVTGASLGIAGLYFHAWCLRWIGKMLGGRASAADLRVLVAWGSLPQAVGLAICIAVFIWLKFSSDASGPFAVVLQTLMAVLGLWSLIMMLFMLMRLQRFGFWRALASGAMLAIILLVIALSIRTFLYQSFSIPSGSQKPTLVVGDYIFASKYAYGYTRYSLPFSPPLFSGRIWPAEPKRGDIAVFRLPKDTSIDYIKRVVGLPGERIQMINGELHINGQPVKRERIDDFIDTDNGRATPVRQWRETLPNGVSYATLDLVDNGFYDNTPVYTVPPGHYFVLGDNRDNSTDSRVMSQFGYVPFENFVGRAGIIFNAIPPHFDRIGTVIR